MLQKLKVLFLCIGNSCRSQMAEGWARHLKGDVIETHSAGIETHNLNHNAVKVMAETGVDISGHRSKNVADLKDVPFDYVVMVCGHAHEACPMFPGKAKIVHVGFDDPPALARAAKMEEEALGHYRRVRDEIRVFVQQLPGSLDRQVHCGLLQATAEHAMNRLLRQDEIKAFVREVSQVSPAKASGGSL